MHETESVGVRYLTIVRALVQLQTMTGYDLVQLGSVYSSKSMGRGRTPVELRTVLDEWATADRRRKPVE